MKEIWRAVEGYEGLYEVSNCGRVRLASASNRGKNPAGMVLKHARHTRGYHTVNLFKDGRYQTRYVHRLVAIAFIPNPEGKREVNHIDGDKDDNSVLNLEWLTTSENQQHSYDVLGRIGPRGEVCGLSKLTEADVRAIREAAANGETTRSIAERFSIGKSQVGRIIKRIQWSHVA